MKRSEAQRGGNTRMELLRVKKNCEMVGERGRVTKSLSKTEAKKTNDFD